MPDENRTSLFTLTVRSGWKVKAEWDGTPYPEYQVDMRADSLHRRTLDFMVAQMRLNRLEEDHLKLLGEYLHRLILDDTISGRLHAAAGSRFLRVDIIFEPGTASLASYPWEYLFCPPDRVPEANGYFLSNRAQVVLTRNLEIPETRALPLRVGEPPLRILFVASSPRKDLDKELPAIEAGNVYQRCRTLVDEVRMRGLGRLPPDEQGRPAPPATWSNFREALLEGPHILHFCGHGQYREPEGELAFTDEAGVHAQWVSEGALEGVIRDVNAKHPGALKLAFLQACESGRSDPYTAVNGLGLLLARLGIPAVVAMQNEIEQGLAQEFADVFYEAISRGVAVDVAVAAARQAIQDDGVRDSRDAEPSDHRRRERARAFGTPVLYYRTSDGVLFGDVVEAAAPGAAAAAPIRERPRPCIWDPTHEVYETDESCGFCKRPLQCPNPRCQTRLARAQRYCSKLACRSTIIDDEAWREFQETRQDGVDSARRAAAWGEDTALPVSRDASRHGILSVRTGRDT